MQRPASITRLKRALTAVLALPAVLIVPSSASAAAAPEQSQAFAAGFSGSLDPVPVDERARRIEQRLEWPVLIAALLTIPAIVLGQSSLGQPWDTVATILNWATWLVFLAEASVMLAVVPDRRAWLRTHPLEVAIVALTPPFLPASLQVARAFRLLRLLRHVEAAALMRRVLSTEGVRDAAVIAAFTVLVGGAAYAAVEQSQDGERLSSWDGVWWAVTTVTTVGYGDSYPTTTPGRMIAIVVMGVGIGFVALLSATVAQRFVCTQQAEQHELRELERRLAAIDERLASLTIRD
jgi:voltage-gated potassium channel